MEDNCSCYCCWLKGIKDFLVNFFVILLAGTILTQCFQVKNAAREEAKKILDASSVLVMKRIYELQRVNLLLKSGNLNDAQKYFKKYKEDAIPAWNIYAPVYSQEIKRYFNEELAKQFSNIEGQHTLFYFFRKAHDSTQEWQLSIEKKESFPNVTCEQESKKSSVDLRELINNGKDFIKNINEEYQNKYQSTIKNLFLC